MTERMMSIPESPSIICADLPVREESLNSMHMAHVEGEGWGGVVILAVVTVICHLLSPPPEPCPPDEEPCPIDPDPDPCPPDIAEIMDPCDD